MTALEDRLRSALADLADEVPASHNAWAEQQRRLAAARRPSRRRPMLAAAAVAVILAGTVPATVVPHSGPARPDGPSGYAPLPDGPYLAIVDKPWQLAEFSEGGRRWVAWAFLERHPGGKGWIYRLCVVGVPAGAPVNSPDRHANSTGCVPVHPWGTTHLVETRSVLGGPTPGSGPLPGLLLFVTAPAVARLDACAADGRPVPVRALGRTEELALFLADYGASYEGFCYTARDAAGVELESGIS
jgi:hypothetical protein